MSWHGVDYRIAFIGLPSASDWCTSSLRPHSPNIHKHLNSILLREILNIRNKIAKPKWFLAGHSCSIRYNENFDQRNRSKWFLITRFHVNHVFTIIALLEGVQNMCYIVKGYPCVEHRKWDSPLAYTWFTIESSIRTTCSMLMYFHHWRVIFYLHCIH